MCMTPLGLAGKAIKKPMAAMAGGMMGTILANRKKTPQAAPTTTTTPTQR